jgi:hypothetical protein
MTYKITLEKYFSILWRAGCRVAGGLPRRSADPAEEALKEAKLLLGEFRGGAVETCPQHHATAPQRTVLK